MSVHFSSTLQTPHSPSMSTWNHVGEAAKNIEGGEQQLERDVMCCPSGIYSGDNQPKTIKTRLNDGAHRHRVQSFDAYTYSTLK